MRALDSNFETFLHENAPLLDAEILKAFGEGTHPDMRTFLYDPLVAYSKNGGKRHRPLSCMLACTSVGGIELAPKALAAGVAIEHFHTAALIHDDIADESTLRRGEPCMHITHGLGLAINAGDFALSSVLGTVVRDNVLNDTEKVQVLIELVDMIDRTIEGQALDIGWAKENYYKLTLEDYYTMATHKTAFYSGAGPLAIGCMLGGGSSEQIESMREFGLKTGLAFQIQDDVLNLTGSKEETKKDFRSDITEGKRTLIVVHAINNSKDAAELIEILSSHTSDATKLTRAVEICNEAGSIEFAHEKALSLTHEAIERIQEAIPENPSRNLLESMADFFISRSN